MYKSDEEGDENRQFLEKLNEIHREIQVISSEFHGRYDWRVLRWRMLGR